jgi:hypothetical protein
MTAEARSAAAPWTWRSARRRRIPPGGAGSASPPAAAGAFTRTNADLARRDLAGMDLVTCARNGDKQAWDALVEQYAR